MLKKLLILALLVGLGYAGYLVWTECLSEGDKTTVKTEIGKVGHKINSKAKELAKGATDKVKEVVHGEKP